MYMKNKKFISIIWWYHKQIFNFENEQNYHIFPIEVMKEEWYDCEIFAIDSKVKIEDDPNFIKWTKVIYYKNFLWYLIYLFKNRKNIIYSNSLTIKTLVVWLIWKKTFFYSHSFPFWNNFIKKIIIQFFYKFFTKIRINNLDEFKKIEKIKKGLWYICPLSISNYFLNKNFEKENYWTWIWNLTDIKNPEMLLKLWKKLKENNINYKIKIIWEDRYNKNWKSFKNLVLENKLENYIELLWYLKPKEIKNILNKSLIYLNTSLWEWQCLAVYEWALAWNYLCLQNILSFPSVFWKNAFYHNSSEELFENIIYIIENKDKFKDKIIQNQNMILEKYNYEKQKECLRKMFLEN